MPLAVTRTVLSLVAVALQLFSASAGHATEPSTPFDIVIRGGRVVDPESAFDGVRDIGLRAGHIALIAARRLEGRKVLDASGLIVAPGFIDLHSHAVRLLAARLQAHDGVTTALELEGGVLDVPAFYDRIAARRWPINYGASASWAGARLAAVKDVTPAGAAVSGLSSRAQAAQRPS